MPGKPAFFNNKVSLFYSKFLFYKRKKVITRRAYKNSFFRKHVGITVFFCYCLNCVHCFLFNWCRKFLPFLFDSLLDALFFTCEFLSTCLQIPAFYIFCS